MCSDVVVVLSNVDFVLQSHSLFDNGIAVNGRLTMSGTERRFVLCKGGPFQKGKGSSLLLSKVDAMCCQWICFGFEHVSSL